MYFLMKGLSIESLVFIKKIEDNFPKYVLTMDKFDLSRDGIIHKNVIDWLLEE